MGVAGGTPSFWHGGPVMMSLRASCAEHHDYREAAHRAQVVAFASQVCRHRALSQRRSCSFQCAAQMQERTSISPADRAVLSVMRREAKVDTVALPGIVSIWPTVTMSLSCVRRFAEHRTKMGLSRLAA